VTADGAYRDCARSNRKDDSGVFRSAALELGNQPGAPPRARDRSNRLVVIRSAANRAGGNTGRAAHGHPPPIRGLAYSTDRVSGKSDTHGVAGLKLPTGQLIEVSHSVKLLCAWTLRRDACRAVSARNAVTESLAPAISQA
jgi:hypothetical protein